MYCRSEIKDFDTFSNTLGFNKIVWTNRTTQTTFLICNTARKFVSESNLTLSESKWPASPITMSVLGL